MAFSLELITGAGAGQKRKLAEGDSLVVGRTEKAQFQVPGDATLSGAHFEVKVAAGKVTVRDAGSRSGTFVQGARLEGEVELKAGDRVQAGQSVFLLDEIPAFGSWILETPPKDWDEMPGQGYKERVEDGPFSNIVFTEEAQDLDKALGDYVADQKLIL
ncbi:MAG: FHA domain-containing protein, partial [Acidobacteriota bacterium]